MRESKSSGAVRRVQFPNEGLALFRGEKARLGNLRSGGPQLFPMNKLSRRILWTLYVLFLATCVVGVLKAAAVRDRQMMERFGGLTHDLAR